MLSSVHHLPSLSSLFPPGAGTSHMSIEGQSDVYSLSVLLQLLSVSVLRKEHLELPDGGAPLGELVAELSHKDDHEHPSASRDTEQE